MFISVTVSQLQANWQQIYGVYVSVPTDPNGCFFDFLLQLILNKVLLLGSATQTIVGRPIVPHAAVCAVVEEHALDAKVIIFKKKRRKNYRRIKGHRQELTKLRITDIQGIEKPEPNAEGKPLKLATEKPEKLMAAA
ncbi:hypothetical protein SLEP1_g22215 [Rubroshorea leprosula]|uniref:Large ribosomal subunit protein bL21m n=1 Tax=Rubroshorea leprosula TaxID=152421 RepID=A0AAV5JDU3_9ROSI|nr:hypothetical protein SLEP1_g22215 [Rubroshorea leprosula]